MSTDTKEPSTLEKMKAIEDRKKKAQLLKVMNLLKNAAKQALEWKEICGLYLEEICKDEKEQKQVIDWINSLDDVALDDERRETLSDRVNGELADEKKRVEHDFEKNPEKYVSALNNTYWGSKSGNVGTAYMASGSTALTANTLNLSGLSVTNTATGMSID